MTNARFKSAFSIGDIVLYRGKHVSVVTGHEPTENGAGEAELLGWTEHGFICEEEHMLLLFTAAEVEERKQEALRKDEERIQQLRKQAGLIPAQQ